MAKLNIFDVRYEVTINSSGDSTAVAALTEEN